MVGSDFSCFHIVFSAIKTTTFLVSAATLNARRQAGVKLVCAWVVCSTKLQSNQIKSNYFVLFFEWNVAEALLARLGMASVVCDEKRNMNGNEHWKSAISRIQTLLFPEMENSESVHFNWMVVFCLVIVWDCVMPASCLLNAFCKSNQLASHRTA